jgi:peptide/nickel transport system ATP-binding protein
MKSTPTSAISLHGVSRRFGQPASIFKRAQRGLDRLRGVPSKNDTVYAVNNVDFNVMPGEVVGLVGESGCGKSTLGRLAAGILPPSDGKVLFRGRDLQSLGSAKRKDAKLKIQMIFQNPHASLNPRLRAMDIVGEAPLCHGLISRGDYESYVDDQFLRAGLDPKLKHRYPHQFSGGQRQRLGIARALAVRPEVLVCDEAVAALDVSIQAQILNLFMELRSQFSLTYLFISHDLGVVEHLADRVAVMYLGRIVEEASVEELFSHAQHPYTQALLAERPRIEGRGRRFVAIKGELPSPLNPPTGCHFHPRCPLATKRCAQEAPALREIAPGHTAACHLIGAH